MSSQTESVSGGCPVAAASIPGLEAEADSASLTTACSRAGFSMVPASEAAPNNVSVAGETSISLRTPEPDSSHSGGWWFWGAADNLRLPAWNGCKLAEWLEQ